MKKSLHVKFVAVMAMLALLCQVPVGAVSLGDISTEPMQPIVPKTSLGLPLADIPEVLSAEQTVQAQNVERLRDQEETQNSAVFRNADGTNTLYLFSENIWYEDANGKKHDYDTTLTQGTQAGSFTSANAGGNLVLPQTVSATTPIRYTENGYTVTMYPVNETIGTGAELMGGEGESRIAVAMTEEETAAINALNEAAAQAAGKTINAATLDAEANTVEYFRANKDATLVCSTLLHGVKNDLLMAADNNIREYSFIVDTDGLTPVQSGETSIALEDGEGQLQGYINAEEIIDANGNKSFENEIAFLAKADGTYLVTMTVDEEFAAEAAYPTSAAVVYSTYNYDASCINDVDVGDYDPNANYASAARLYVGRLNGYKYRSFFQLIVPDEYKISPNEVSSVYMNIYEGSSNTSNFVLDPKIPNHIWDYTTITWNSSANQATLHDTYNEVAAPISTTVTYNSQYYMVMMTDFVKASLRNYVDDSLAQTIHENRGFALTLYTEADASPATHLRIWNSTNHSSNKPYVVVNYENNIGAAKNYEPENSTGVNCLGYALGICEFIGAAFMPAIDETDTVESYYADHILAENGELRTSWDVQLRTLASSSSVVRFDEYRIAMRLYNVNYGTNALTGLVDYHFLVQTTDGWAHKPGKYASDRYYNPCDPSDSSYWPRATINGVNYYYNSNTIYFAKTVEGDSWYDIA